MAENTTVEVNYSHMGEDGKAFQDRDHDHAGLDMKAIGADIGKFHGFLDQRDLDMLSTEVGIGRELGSSKTMIEAVQRASKQVQTKVDELKKSGNVITGDMRRRIESEAQSILRRELMQARAEYIKRSRMSLPGW